MYTGDVNGDGKTEILVAKTGGMYVYGLNTAGSIELLWTEWQISNEKSLLFGDYNGDGKIDFMVPGRNESHFYTYLSTGKSFVAFDGTQPFSNKPASWNGKPGTETLNQYYLIPSDINGDGKTDMIQAQTTTKNGTSNGTITVTFFHNLGTLEYGKCSFSNGFSQTEYTNVRHYPIPVFLNPDRLNQKLEFGFISDNSITLFRARKDQRTESLLSSVYRNSVLTKVSYEELVSGKNVDGLPLYEEGNRQTYPYIDLSNLPALRVVSKITRVFNDQSVSQAFGYGEAVAHVQGLGFLGFGKLIRSNWHTSTGDANRIFNISIHNPQLRGALITNFASKGLYIRSAIVDAAIGEQTPTNGIADGASLSDYISRSSIKYRTELLPNKVFVNVPIVNISKDMLTGTFSTTTYEYDDYYNQKKVITSYGGQGTKTEDFTYGNNVTAPYYVGRLLAAESSVNNGSSSFSNREEYAYTGWHPSRITKKVNNSLFNTEDIVYDAFGNIVERTLTTPSGGTRTAKMEYDLSGRYIVKMTDFEGLTTLKAYNTAAGTLATETNPFGQVRQFSYDSWGREVSRSEFVGDLVTQTFYQRDEEFNEILYQTNSEGCASAQIINPLGQRIETRVKSLFGQYIGKSFLYDDYGRVVSESEPTKPGYYNQWNSIEYDEYGRVKKQTSYTGRSTSFSYSGLSVTVNDGIKSVTTTRNAMGHTESVQDPGGSINYTYFANGDLKRADYGGISQTIEQDAWGRKTKLTDPSAGQYQYEYDEFGQLTKETGPKGVTNYTYDTSGKLIQKKITGDDTNMQLDYTYDATTKLLTASSLVNSDGNNASYSYTYDQQKRLSTVTEENPHARFVTGYTYNSYNHVATENHEAKNKLNNITVSKTVEMQYQNGELLQTTLQGSGQVLWKANSLDNKGRISTVLQGSSLKTTFLYDQYGLPQQRTVERVSGSPAMLMALGYSFDSQRGLLNSRSNSAFSWSENFSYDNLDRLTSFNDNDGNKTQTYDSRGRIESSSQLGSYSYESNSYRQSELALNPEADTWYQGHSLQQISYNAFKSPVTIHEQGSERISFQYNAALARSHMYYGGEQEDKMQRRFRRHYSEDGSVEITDDMQEGSTSFVFYLGGDAYSAPAIWKQVHTANQTTQNLYYLHRDHLGSIVLITNEQGNAVEKRQFDAWGNIVKLTDGSGNNLAAFVVLDRGYTGHEHLLRVGLIHMNGRLYDPKLHRFLSPDNYIQDPFNTQNFNRFGYVLNNPLSYVDESGEFLHLIIGAVVGGVINWATHGAKFSWRGLGYFATGAAAGALGAGIGAGINVPMAGGSFSSGFWGTAKGVASLGFLSGAATGSGAGFTNGFVSGVGNAALDGGSFGQSFGAGFKSGLGQALAGGVSGGVVSGITAASKGLNFFTGESNFDISNGIGAYGDIPDVDQVRAKYVGNFHGSDVYETGAFSKGTGITLPGRGITVSPGSYSLGNDIGLVRHEFGHVLQIRALGAEKYLKYVGRESIASAIKQKVVESYYHKTNWTEVWANNLSWEYFRGIPGALKQTLWDETRFPLRWSNLDDYYRVKRLINYGF